MPASQHHQRARGTILALAAAIALTTTGQRAAHADYLIVLNKSEATASIIDPESGVVVATVPVGKAPHEGACSPDGRLAVVCNYGARQAGNTLTVIDVARRKAIRTIDLGKYRRPHGVQFLADGEHVLVTSEMARSLLIVNVQTGEVERAIDTNANGSHMVAVSPDSKRAFVANIASGSISAIDIERGELIKVIPTGAGAEGVAVSPDGKYVWVTNRLADTVGVVDVHSMTLVDTIDVALTDKEKQAGMGFESPQGKKFAFPLRVQFTVDGRRALVSCAGAGLVRVFDAASRKEVARVAMDGAAMDDEGRLFGEEFGSSPVPVGILMAPSGKFAYVASTRADIVTVIDVANWRIVKRLKAGREPDGMAWSVLDDADAPSR